MTQVIISKQSRRERKKAAVRSQIVAAGVELFTEYGLAEVTVEQIAEAADVGKGTIYNYFQAKEDIVVAFMVDIEHKLSENLKRFAEVKGSLDSILADFLLLQFKLKEPYHKFVRVLLGQMFLRTEQFLPYMVEMQRVIDPPLETLFQSLQQRGAIRSDVKIKELLFVFKTIQFGLTALWAVEGPPFHQTERTLRQEVKLFCEGLRERDS